MKAFHSSPGVQREQDEAADRTELHPALPAPPPPLLPPSFFFLKDIKSFLVLFNDVFRTFNSCTSTSPDVASK